MSSSSLAVATRLAFAGHQLDVLEAQHFDLARLHPTQQGAHARHQLVVLEGLDDVVVGAAIQAR